MLSLAYFQSNGVLLVDYLDIHYYPQASGVYSNAEDSATVQRRFNAPKALYNSGYTDESWINQQINLIPRMKSIIAANCPSMKLAITEYSFGDESTSFLSSICPLLQY